MRIQNAPNMKKRGYKHPLGSPRNFILSMALGLILAISAITADMRSRGLPDQWIARYEAFVRKVEKDCNDHTLKQYDFFSAENDKLILQFYRIEIALTPIQREKVRRLRMRYLRCMRAYHLSTQ